MLIARRRRRRSAVSELGDEEADEDWSSPHLHFTRRSAMILLETQVV